ncbi:hypothetical protein ACUXV3_19965 (plasmid) [Roseobacteraceae bacterium NS-SX3]
MGSRDGTALANYRRIALAAVLLLAAGGVAGIAIERGLGLAFSAYYDTGQRVLAGQIADLYQSKALIAGAPPLGHTTYPGMPLASYALAPLAWLDPHSALAVFKALNTLALWGGLLLLYRHLKPLVAGGPAQEAAFLALYLCAALLFQPFWTIYRTGGSQMPFIFLLYVIGLIHHTRGNYAVSAACLFGGGLLNPEYFLALALPFAMSPGRFRLAVLVLAAGTAAASLLLCGAEVHRDLAQRLVYESRHLELPYLSANMMTWAETLMLRFADYGQLYIPGPVAAAVFALRLAAAGLLLLVFRQVAAACSGPAQRHFCFLVTILLQPIIGFTTFSPELAQFFLPLMCVLAWRQNFPPAARAVLWVALGFAVFHNAWVTRFLIRVLGEDSWADLMLLGTPKSVTMFLTVLLLLLWRQGFIRSYRGASGLLQRGPPPAGLPGGAALNRLRLQPL